MKSAGLLNTPSLQHAIALVGSDVPSTLRNFEALEAAKIDFNYRPSERLYKPLMEGIFTEEQALRQCALIKKPKSATANSGLISAFSSYAREQTTPWFNSFAGDYFPIAPNIAIPVRPSGFFARQGRLCVVWVQTWKGRTLSPYQRALFYTVLQQRVFVGEDFSSAELDFVDLMAPRPRVERAVAVSHRKDFDTVTERELKQAMDVLLEAFTKYVPEREARREETRSRKEPPATPLFDQKRRMV